MNANDLTYGIEIETIAPDCAVRERRPADRGLPARDPGARTCPPDGLPRRTARSTTATADTNARSSARSSAATRGWRQVAEVLRTLEAKGHRVNASCRCSRSRRVAPRMAEHRPGPAGDDRRLRREGPLRDHGLEEPRAGRVLRRGAEVRQRQGRQAEPRPRPLPRLEPHQPRPRDERHGRIPRVLAGRSTATKVLGWVQVCLGLVERAINAKRSPLWDPKPLDRRMEEGRPRSERM